VVENGSLQDDQDRRDFTINALAISLNKNYGELLDPFDGLKILKKILKHLLTLTSPTPTTRFG
jgi:tRNA nucleotidyltransferase (CCA-adding enzyme)